MHSLVTYLLNLVPYKVQNKLSRQNIAIEHVNKIKEGFLSPVNYCHSDEKIDIEGWMTDPSLSLVTDANNSSKRLPLTKDLFDRASAIAQIHGNKWFAVANSDLILTEKWKQKSQALMQEGFDAIIFPRTDVDVILEDGSLSHPSIYHRGQDLFLCKVETWEEIRHHFRSYVFGEAYWDNIFTAIFLSHCNGCLLMDSLGLCLHQRHERNWGESPFFIHNRLLATGPDMIYHTRWSHFHLGWHLRQEDQGKPLTQSQIQRLAADMFIPPVEEEIEFSIKMGQRAERLGLKEIRSPIFDKQA